LPCNSAITEHPGKGTSDDPECDAGEYEVGWFGSSAVAAEVRASKATAETRRFFIVTFFRTFPPFTFFSRLV
jgi:hypothetical protein